MPCAYRFAASACGGGLIARIPEWGYDLGKFMDATILWRIRGYILLATFATLIVFGGVGYAIDRYYGTLPKGLLVSVFLSFPVSNILAIRLAKAMTKPS